MNKIIKIVLTGGSSAGKTSAQKYLIEKLDCNMSILLVPEVASLLLSNGVCRDEISKYSFQKNIFSLQKSLERIVEDIANEINKDVLIICDRGTCDGIAFLSDADWARLIATYDTTFEKELNAYNAVFFMPSVSVDYPELYINTNIRNYPLLNAQIENEKLYKIWKSHKNFHVINNHPTFEMKLEELLVRVKKVLDKE